MDSGCYIYYDGSLDSLKDEPTTGKKKRDAQQLNGNCSDHMTGLAAAAFGLFAKIANEFNEMVLWMILFYFCFFVLFLFTHSLMNECIRFPYCVCTLYTHHMDF